MVQPLSEPTIEAHISGTITGQVAVGNNILQINADHGAVVNVAMPEQRIEPRLRAAPSLLPRPFPGLLGRDQQATSAIEAIRAGVPAEFHGESGIGKTALLRHLARADLAKPGLGEVYVAGRAKPLADLMQFLFDAFYETGAGYVPPPSELTRRLNAVEGLVLLDDSGLAREELETLLDCASGCTFVVAGEQRSLWGEGRSEALQGLRPEAAVVLFERELGRPLSEQERPVVRDVCARLGGHPLRIIRAAAATRADGSKLLQAARPAPESPEGDGDVGTPPQPDLTDDERRALGVLALLQGAPVEAGHVAAIGGLESAEAPLQSLVTLGFAQSHSPVYSVTGPLPVQLQASLPLPELATEASRHFLSWAEEHRTEPAVLLDAIDPMLVVLERDVREGRWRDVLRLARAFESALILSRRWAAWARVLEWESQAATQLGDREAQGWSLHQVGTRALCLDDPRSARRALRKALSIRRSLKDAEGARATAHNLGLLGGGGWPPRRQSGPWRPRPPLLRGMWFVVPAAIVVAGGLALWGAHRTSAAAIALTITGDLEFRQPVTAHSSSDAPKSVTLSNSGKTPVRIVSISLSGKQRAEFILGHECRGTLPATLAPGEHCTVDVTFAPVQAGHREAELLIEVARPRDHQTQRYALSVSGIGRPQSTGSSPTPSTLGAISVYPNALVFASGERMRNVTISNTGKGPVTFSSIRLVPPNTRFTQPASLDMCSGGPLDPRTSCTVGIQIGRGRSASATLVIQPFDLDEVRVLVSGPPTTPPSTSPTPSQTATSPPPPRITANTAVYFDPKSGNFTVSVTMQGDEADVVIYDTNNTGDKIECSPSLEGVPCTKPFGGSVKSVTIEVYPKSGDPFTWTGKACEGTKGSVCIFNR